VGVKRLRRSLFNTAAALSLALCVAACVLWVRSYWRYDSGIDGRVALASHRGHFFWLRSFSTSDARDYYAGPVGEADQTRDIIRKNAKWRLLGFSYTAVPDVGVLVTPSWFVAGLLAIVPAVWLRRRRGVRRRCRLGLCPTCGYDLRATPDRCPECGTLGQGRSS
jgi:hypothetical protein